MRTQRTPTQTDPLLLPLRSPSRKNSQKMVWAPSEFEIQVFGFMYLSWCLLCCYLAASAVSADISDCKKRVAEKKRVAAELLRNNNGIAEENEDD